MAALRALSDTGGLAVLLPLIGIISVWLLLTRQLTALAWWGTAVAICVGATAILKIYFFVCPPAADFNNPSGHASLSTLVYGALTLLVSRSVDGWRRYVAVFLGASFICSVGVSRLLLHTHSFPEVLTGWVIGSSSLAIFARAFRPRDYPYRRALIVLCAVVTVSLTGQEVRAEQLLHALGLHLRHMGLKCINLRQLEDAGFTDFEAGSFMLVPPQTMKTRESPFAAL